MSARANTLFVMSALSMALLVENCNRSPMGRLLAATRTLETRPTEARVCGFGYALPPGVHRGENDEPASPSRQEMLTAAVTLIHATDGDTEARHARAVADLLLGHLPQATKGLEELLKTNANDARFWSDLAAARYELGRGGDDVREYLSALAAAASAIERDPSLPEARFNYALAAAALRLRGVAAESFRRYLTIDPGSAWSDEARQRLSGLLTATAAEEWNQTRARLEAGLETPASDAAVARFPQETRTWAEGEYLARWAEAFASGDSTQAARWLGIARGIADALRARSGESLLYDAVSAVDHASKARRALLADAYLIYRRGRIAYSKRNTAAALPLLKQAERAFAAAQSPMALVARLWGASASIDRGEFNDATFALESLMDTPHSYEALRAYVFFDRCLIFSHIGHLFEGLEAAQKAEELFEHLGETENSSRTLASMARAFMVLGRPEIAWKLHRRAFEEAAASGTALTLDHVLRAAALDELKSGRHDTARALLDVEIALPALSPRLRVDALLLRLKANDDVGDLAAIRHVALSIPDTRVRDDALDDINAAAARQSAPARALALLNESIAFRARMQDQLALGERYVARAQLLRRLGRAAEAEADLLSSLALIERQRSTILPDDLRDTFFDMSRETADELFDLYAERGRYETAFDLIERTRARGLVERLHSADLHPQSLTAAEIAKRVPARTLIAEYTYWRGAVVILALRSDGLKAHVVHCDHLDERAAALNDAIVRNATDSARSLGQELMNVLVAPFAADLRGIESLVVIPDEHVAEVPFAALRDTATGRYLIENVSISTAVSASTYVAWEGSGSALLRSRALLVGNPALDTKRLPELPALPSAGEEVKAIRRLYRNATVLTGIGATRSAVLREITASDPIHLATHAIMNSRDPSLSLIALAPNGADSGLLYLRDIAGLHLKQAPVVVLAACRTASRAAGYGSVRSLASAFLAAGSRSVVGSMWDVDDEATLTFSTLLHQRLVNGVNPTNAIRDAQLAMLHSRNTRLSTPAAWGGFQSLCGAVTPLPK